LLKKKTLSQGRVNEKASTRLKTKGIGGDKVLRGSNFRIGGDSRSVRVPKGGTPKTRGEKNPSTLKGGLRGFVGASGEDARKEMKGRGPK